LPAAANPAPPGDLGDPWLTGLLRSAFSPLVEDRPWGLAAVAAAGERTGTWLSGASLSSSFQIGTVTTTFTALLLAVMATSCEVALEDPLGRYLPAAAGSATTLAELATHTSGYPRAPRRVQWRMLLRLRDPYALVRDRDVDRSLERLSRELGPGPHDFSYSNFGYGVLSRALAAAAGQPFGELLRQKVLAPLDLREVTLESDPDPARRRLFGHNFSGQEMEHWHNPALPGASSLFSSIEGMRRYLVANLSPESTPMEPAFRLVHEPRCPAGPKMQAALGWLVRETDDGLLHWQNGGVAGFASFIGFDLARRVGIAVLMSRRHGPDLDEAAIGAISELRRA
jgi:D-alanyl-D-alanine-carboxypeptidase/D-alanyl-D-alanine-endopeptidase